MTVMMETSLPNLFARGKVRDTYDLPAPSSGGGDRLLIVATDRISAFDVVLPVGIPDKGAVLNQLSAFWFEKTGDIVQNHLVETVTDPRAISEAAGRLDMTLPSYLAGRSMIVRKLERIPVECVAR